MRHILTNKPNGIGFYPFINQMRGGGIDFLKEAPPEPFYIQNLTSEDCTITLAKTGSSNDIILEYSTDNQQTWTTFTTNGAGDFNIPANGKAYIKGDNSRFSSFQCTYKFSFDKRCNVGGEIMSLVGGATNITVNMFQGLFNENANLVNAENLILPDTVEQYCYYYMFSGCTSLTTAPVLPATTLVYSCYGYMFYGCTNLNYIKVMGTNHNAACTSNWVYGVSSSGTFVKNASATWNVTGVNGIPSGWTVETA